MDHGAGCRARGFTRVRVDEPVLQHFDGLIGGRDRVAAATPMKQHRVPAVRIAGTKSNGHTERRRLKDRMQPRAGKAAANKGNGGKRIQISEHACAIHEDNVGVRSAG